jgi:uncharacterized protein YprB with RNaseH-like and TPR domain
MTGLADKYSRLAALRPARPGLSRPAMLRAPNREDFLSQLLGAGIATNHYGEHICVRNWFSSPEFAHPSDLALDLLSRSRDEAMTKRMRKALADPEKWLFLDTETTGLSGGTGTYAFLVGLAWWDAGGLQVEQLFLRDFAEEHSILHEVARRLAERPVLVTFNGKTFDWPLLENRFTMTRAIAVPRLAAHLDLVHPARALWRPRLGSVRLVDLERYVLDPVRLGWHRDDDVASTVIPQQYFDYLRGGPVEPLVAILRHNQMDLRGLAALFGKINALLADEQQIEVESLDLFGLSRFLQRRGDAQRAHSTCAQAIALGLPFEFDRQARGELALLAKRRGEHESAAALWEELAKDEQNGVRACEQLAIYHERRRKDFGRALEFAQLALARLRRTQSISADPRIGKKGAGREQSLANRVARLRLRIAGEARAFPTLPLEPAGRLAANSRAVGRAIP